MVTLCHPHLTPTRERAITLANQDHSMVQISSWSAGNRCTWSGKESERFSLHRRNVLTKPLLSKPYVEDSHRVCAPNWQTTHPPKDRWQARGRRPEVVGGGRGAALASVGLLQMQKYMKLTSSLSKCVHPNNLPQAVQSTDLALTQN